MKIYIINKKKFIDFLFENLFSKNIFLLVNCILNNFFFNGIGQNVLIK